MDTQDVSMVRSSLVKDFDETIAKRAEKHQYLRGRNNVTSCRSPTRDTNLIKNEQQYKRQLEFQKRRSVSPDPQNMKAHYRTPKTKSSAKKFSMKPHSPETQSKYSNIQVTPSSNGQPVKLTQSNGKVHGDPSNSNWALLWSEPVTPVRQDKSLTRKQEAAPSIAISPIKKTTQQWVKGPEKRQNIINAQKTSTRTSMQTENILHAQQFSLQTKTTLKKKTRQDASAQTDSGFITVKEADVQQLTDYLQEALWREEALKKKLAVLQDRASTILNSSNNIWTARCNEDLLRIKIKALEAQLQVCLQKFPKDGVKKLAMQMEKQKLVYEEKAVAALQKAMQEKADALTNADILQEALQTSKAESVRWQSLYEELKQSTAYLKKSQEVSIGQLQQLHGQLELSRGREAELRDEVGPLQQENEELRYNFSLLEEDNRTLREETESLRDCSTESQDLMEEQLRLIEVSQVKEQFRLKEASQVEKQFRLKEASQMEEQFRLKEASQVEEQFRLKEASQVEEQFRLKEASQVEDQLRHTQDRLQQKEKECAELQTELEAMEQECQSTQARLTQCREELRLLSHHRRSSSRGLCGSWRWLCMFLVLLLVIAVAMLWLWHPPFRDQVEDMYTDIQTRIDNYLMEMDFSQVSGCFRPI